MHNEREELLNAAAKFELWFFRDCNAGTRRCLFSMLGLPVEEITSDGIAREVLRRIVLPALTNEPVQPSREAVAEEYMTVTLSRDGLVESHNAFDADYDEMVVATQTIVRVLQERLSNRKLCPYSHGGVLRTAPLPAIPVDVPAFEEGEGEGFYVASRATIPERSAMWRELRDAGLSINSTWIDEAGDGETACFSELWSRIVGEIARSKALILYAEQGDFPLKGALTEAGIAIGMGKPVAVVTPGVAYEARSMRPIGSWVSHPLCQRFETVAQAIAALSTPPAQVDSSEGAGS